MNRPLVKLVAALAGCAALVAACNSPKSSQKAGQNVNHEQQAIAQTFNRLSDSQPVPSFDYSQERQTVIDVETIRAEGTHGTAVATTLNGELLWWCPTAGAPVPSTYQLSSDTQYVDIPGDHTRDRFPLEQGEATGVYIGDSAATWTVCLDENGKAFGKYEEQNVGWTSGVVGGLPEDMRARVDEITFNFTLPEDK